MLEIQDQRHINRWLNSSKITDYFDNPELRFKAYQYEKGELLAAPYLPFPNLLFLVKGRLQVYSIDYSGRISPIIVLHPTSMLGDVEFYTGGPSSNYVEAQSTAVCLALPIQENRAALDRDMRFLHRLLACFYEKLSFADLDLKTSTLEDRLLAYMTHYSPNHEIKGIEDALYRLHCSRRQIQRVVKKLCDEQRIVKLGKGHYRLN